MNQLIPSSLLFGVIIFMCITYFGAYTVYGESSSWEDLSNIPLDDKDVDTAGLLEMDEDASFEEWINTIWVWAKHVIVYNSFGADAIPDWAYSTYFHIYTNYKYYNGGNPNLFYQYQNGYSWWENSHYLDKEEWLIFTLQDFRYSITTYYDDFLEFVDAPEGETQDNMFIYLSDNPVIKTINDWTYRITGGIGLAWDVLSFNGIRAVPDSESDMPNYVYNTLMLIIIPCWIIIFLGILPLIMRFVEIIIQGLDLIIPDWL